MVKGKKFTKWTERFNVNEILNLIEQGKNIKELAKILEIPNRRLGEMLKHFNIDIKTKNHSIKKDHDFFENITTEIKAYLLGYTIADGCISIESKKKNNVVYSYAKRIAYCVSVDDREVIDLIQKNISPNSVIKEIQNNKGANNRKRQLILRISSQKIVDDLIKLEVKPNKTYNTSFTFPFNKIDKSLHKHLIRGFFDGDGSISKNDIQFVSTSINFLKQIEEFFTKEIPQITFRYYKCKGKTVDYAKLYFNLGGGSRNKVYNLLYENSDYYLNRKKIKFNI